MNDWTFVNHFPQEEERGKKKDWRLAENFVNPATYKRYSWDRENEAPRYESLGAQITGANFMINTFYRDSSWGNLVVWEKMYGNQVVEQDVVYWDEKGENWNLFREIRWHFSSSSM